MLNPATLQITGLVFSSSLVTSLTLTAAALLAPTTPANGQQVKVTGFREENFHQPFSGSSAILVGLSPDASRDLGGGGLLWDKVVEAPDGRYSRILLEKIVPDAGEYAFEIRSGSTGELLTTYSSDDLTAHEEFLTELLPSDKLWLRLLGANQLTKTPFQVSAVVFPTASKVSRPETILPHWRTASPNDSSSLAPLFTSAAMLHIGVLDRTCSSILVAEATLLTNRHCLELSPAYVGTAPMQWGPCDDIIAEFAHFGPNTRGYQRRCERAIANDSSDLAVLKLEAGETPDLIKRRPLGLAADVGTNEQISILHFPVGLPLRFESGCRVDMVEGSAILHSCDTVSGSSGAALVNKSGDLAGLHFRGPFPLGMTFEEAERWIELNGSPSNSAVGAPDIGHFIAEVDEIE